MGALLAYTVYTGIFLLAGYLLYKLAMAGEKQMLLNRGVLLGIYALAFAAWPLSRLSWPGSDGPAAGTIDFDLLPVGVAGDTATQPLWPMLLIGLYVAGIAVTASLTIATAVRLVRLVRSGQRHEHDGYTLVLLPEGKVAPFSWGRYVVMSADDYETAGATVTAHELAHIHHRHCLDLMLAQAVCIFLWYNPAAWLMREELKTVHEYQADDTVLASGIDPRTYQMLLIKKAVGTRFQSLANSLNHSKLKKRITMMYKEKNSGLRRLRGLVLALAPVAAIAVVNIPAVAGCLDGMRAASLETTDEPIKVVAAGTIRKDTQNISENKPDVLAQYPGGEGEMFKYLASNIKYPEAAANADHQGRTVVQFTVKSDGSLSDFEITQSSYPELDAEAIRVISSMPAWTPAQADGKAVASFYTLPIQFKLPGDKTAKSKKSDKAFEEIVVVGYGRGADNSKTIQLRNSDLSGPNAPTITVDGKKVNTLDNIKPENIESISVFKDKPEYPNGLVEITLKK